MAQTKIDASKLVPLLDAELILLQAAIAYLTKHSQQAQPVKENANEPEVDQH